MKTNQETQQEMNHLQMTIGKIMRIGVAIASIVMLFGYVLLLVKHSSGYPAGKFPTRLDAIYQGILTLKPYAIMMAGVFLLILTPVLRIVTSIYSFFKEKDKLYTIITITVLIILIISFFLGHAAI